MNTIVTFYRTLNKITKSLFFISIALIVYGFISQHAPIYFFWESERIGWTVLIVAVILASIQGIGYVKQKGKKPYGPYIVMGFFAFSLLINGILRLIIPHTEVYSAGYDYLNIESKELGQIISIRNLP